MVYFRTYCFQYVDIFVDCNLSWIHIKESFLKKDISQVIRDVRLLAIWKINFLEFLLDEKNWSIASGHLQGRCMFFYPFGWPKWNRADFVSKNNKMIEIKWSDKLLRDFLFPLLFPFEKLNVVNNCFPMRYFKTCTRILNIQCVNKWRPLKLENFVHNIKSIVNEICICES